MVDCSPYLNKRVFLTIRWPDGNPGYRTATILDVDKKADTVTFRDKFGRTETLEQSIVAGIGERPEGEEK